MTGSAAGVALLLCLPSAAFDRAVPFLLLAASAMLLIQPRVSAWRATRVAADRFLLPCGLFAMALYSGYFGAGAGVMALALLLVGLDQNLVRANALKNMFLGLADLVAAIGIAIFGPVDWAVAAPLALGLLVGSRVGPALTRVLPGTVLRVLVARAGLGWRLPDRRPRDPTLDRSPRLAERCERHRCPRR